MPQKCQVFISISIELDMWRNERGSSIVHVAMVIEDPVTTRDRPEPPSVTTPTTFEDLFEAERIASSEPCVCSPAIGRKQRI